MLIVLNLFAEFIPNKYFFHGAVIGTLSISILQGWVAAQELINNLLIKLEAFPAMDQVGMSFNTTINVLKTLPFEGIGFPWLLPALGLSLLFGFGYIIMQKKEKAPSMKRESPKKDE